LGTLKSFIIREELKTSHAERYITYIDRYHEHVFHDLKKKLEEEWESSLKSIIKKYPVHPEVVQDATLKNPKATTEITLSHKAEKLITSRSPTPLEVAPSIKIPLVYSQEERKLVTKALLDVAETAFKDTTTSWGEIFNYEKSGRIKPWFKISGDNEEIRLQLALSESNSESYKTLYAVRMEFGKKNSKLKDFDRLYLVNFIK
jgi:hypothetical protein